MLDYDLEMSRRIESTYTSQDVVEQRRQVLDVLAPKPGERVLDIGVGPGFLASEIAEMVGPSGLVCGVDTSDSMLGLAQARGGQTVRLRHGSATEIPYPQGEFDAAVSTQVLEYVADIPTALAEAYRVLRPGGRLVVLDTDWDSIVWRSGDEQRMNRVLAAWAEHLADPHLPRTLIGALRRAGFTVAPPQVIVLLNVGYAPDTYSAGMIGVVAAFVPGRHGLTADDVEGWQADLIGHGDDGFFSLNRYLFCATKPASR
jgi:ubiquinone/menaquinone biosynthesis C-methylase UbiE